MADKGALTSFSDIEAKPPPKCKCGEPMIYTGGTHGWVCPEAAKLVPRRGRFFRTRKP